MKNLNHFWIKIGFIFFAFVAIYQGTPFLVPEPLFGIRQNSTESLPFTYFLSTKLRTIQPNIFVSLEHPLSSLLLAKQVIGLAGDRISIRNQIFSINGREYGRIQKKTLSGRLVHPIEEGEIPQGYVFVYAPHPYSYDSRYAEFGLVTVEQLKEKLWPLF